MNLQDITAWTVTADHKARPKNPNRCTDGTYVSCVNLPDGPNCDGCNDYIKFEQDIKEHTYACSETLLPGDYPAEMFELVWQLYWPDNSWINCANWYYSHYNNDFKKFASDKALETRQYLQLKQPVKEQEVKPEESKPTYLPLSKEDQHKIYWDSNAREKMTATLNLPESKEVETIEQAAQNMAINITKRTTVQEFFIAGANWQKEQNTDLVYTRAQMIEFGEKVREECLKGVWYKEGLDYENIQSINIENLLKK